MRVTPLALALICGSCSAIPGTRSNVDRQAREALQFFLNDADTARLANVQIVPAPSPHSGKLICGEVNGKNKMGAYIGFRNFYAYPDEKIANSDPGDVSGPEQRAFNAGRREARKAGCRFR